jgi:uncharacterized SAM-binding protein YcdF (DUF218 family)
MVKNKPELDADPRLFDYLIAKLLFWKGKTLPIPESEERIIEISGQADIDDKSKSRNGDKGLTHSKKSKGFFFFGFILLFIAQLSVELSSGKPSWLAGVLFVIGLLGLVFAFMFNKTKTDKEAMETNPAGKAKSVNWLALIGAVLLSIFNFFLWRNNGLGWVQVLVWLISVALMAYLSHEKPNVDSIDDELSPAKRLKPIRWKRQYDRGYVLVLLIVVLVVFLFKILFIRKTPVELISQQVETFLAVDEILAGSRAILFPRNVVSEPMGYYYYALFGVLFPANMRLTAFHFANIVSFCVGLFFLYRLALLLFDKWVAIATVFLYGIGFWPILQNTALIGNSLVFPLLAGALFFLFRGLLKEKRTDVFLFGLISGFALFANKLFLMMPVLTLMVILVWWISTRDRNPFPRAMAWLALSLLTMLIIALPLIATISNNAEVYFAPILSRMSSFEVPLVGNPLVIFLKNFLAAIALVNWSNNSTWVDGIAKRPALDCISAVLFLLGLVWLSTRWKKEKRWDWLTIPLLWILLLIPSVMSLAFPLENPSLSRAYGAAVPVFMLSGVGLVVFVKQIQNSARARIIIASLIALLAVFLNYRLLHGSYIDQYRLNAWNTREMSATIMKFEADYGEDAQAWVVSHPHWVDERAVAILSGKDSESLRLDIQSVNTLSEHDGSQLFILNIEAVETLDRLKVLYPNGVESIAQSTIKGKDFRIYLVPKK